MLLSPTHLRSTLQQQRVGNETKILSHAEIDAIEDPSERKQARDTRTKQILSKIPRAIQVDPNEKILSFQQIEELPLDQQPKARAIRAAQILARPAKLTPPPSTELRELIVTQVPHIKPKKTGVIRRLLGLF